MQHLYQAMLLFRPFHYILQIFVCCQALAEETRLVSPRRIKKQRRHELMLPTSSSSLFPSASGHINPLHDPLKSNRTFSLNCSRRLLDTVPEPNSLPLQFFPGCFFLVGMELCGLHRTCCAQRNQNYFAWPL